MMICQVMNFVITVFQNMNPNELLTRLSELACGRVRKGERQYPPLHSRKSLRKLTRKVKRVVEDEETRDISPMKITLYVDDLVIQE